LSTKIHGTTDALGNPTNIVLSAGQRADISFARELVGEQRPKHLIADKGYDADHFLDWLREHDIGPVIPARRCRKKPRVIDMNLYADRNKVERLRLNACGIA
jgi:transposase